MHAIRALLLSVALCTLGAHSLALRADGPMPTTCVALQKACIPKSLKPEETCCESLFCNNANPNAPVGVICDESVIQVC
jgi:hypothetical protein